MNIEQIFPIYQVEHGALVSASGDITIVYEAGLPDIFTLSGADYEMYHQSWVSAVRVLAKHTIVHKKDRYCRNSYKTEVTDKSFLSAAAGRHFAGRPYLDHRCYILVTKKAEDRKAASSAYSGLLRKSIVPKQTTDPRLFPDFLEKAGQFERILSDSGFVGLRRLDDDALLGLLEQYCFNLAAGEPPMIKDVHLKDGLQIGDQYGQLFTLGDAEDLPALCGTRIDYDKYSTDRTHFPVGFAAGLNLLLDCDHEYNQYIFIGDAQKTLKLLEAKKRRLQSLSAYSRENAIARDATNDFLNEAISKGRLPVKAHFNVIVWTREREQLQDIKNLVGSAMAQIGATAKQETDGAPQIWWAGIPGNAVDFPMNDTFDTFLEQACCFLNLETNYGSDPSGIRFCDRLSGKPVLVDLFDSPRAKGITSNMGTLVCGTSGGGKSMTVNHILRTLYDQSAHCVVVDIGGSYLGLCELVGGYYFTYEEQNPIRFNPFYLPEGHVLDTEK